jgi:hypothetical protein
MASRTCEEYRNQENGKEEADKEKFQEGRRTFRVKRSKKTPGKKTEFQTACFPPLSFRR